MFVSSCSYFLILISGLLVRWLSGEVIEETEELAYDFLTFVANFGGTLGLFVGFSFFMFWDLFNVIVNAVKTNFSFE